MVKIVNHNASGQKKTAYVMVNIHEHWFCNDSDSTGTVGGMKIEEWIRACNQFYKNDSTAVKSELAVYSMSDLSRPVMKQGDLFKGA
ncbi:hypothetical protein [Sediminitomix flava]|nr:hypothetical protein [Sediminitomix flava]